MHDFIICKKKLPVPENFLNLDWSKEPFRTNSLSNSFQNYIISKDGFLYKQAGEKLERINYHGFIYFSTHFFDEDNTRQYYVSFFSSFDNKGCLEELSLEGFKEYKLEDYDLNKYLPVNKSKNINFFLKTYFLIKSYFRII